MKLIFSTIYLLFNIVIYAQEKWRKIEEINTREIIINCKGLDDLVIKNSKDKFLRISLDSKSSQRYAIDTRQTLDITEVYFQLDEDNFTKEGVFRKFITKRVNNASTTIEVPIGKSILIYGEGLGVVSESYRGDLSVYISTGNVYLNKIEGTCEISFFKGNLYAMDNSFSMNIISNKGAITLNGRNLKSPVHQKKINTDKLLNVKTVLGNIFIDTLNPISKPYSISK